MINVKRLQLRLRIALHEWQARRLIAQANRLLARSRQMPNPGYDELSNPVFLVVMALATVVLVIDMADAWRPVAEFIMALGEFVMNGA